MGVHCNGDWSSDVCSSDLVIEVDVEENVLVVKGAVPGPNGGYVVVRRAKR
jgi:ribosomal protein L3